MLDLKNNDDHLVPKVMRAQSDLTTKTERMVSASPLGRQIHDERVKNIKFRDDFNELKVKHKAL